MAKRIFEFSCGQHTSDAYIGEDIQVIECRVCQQPANRIISAPMVKLDPISGHFPSATEKWENAHRTVYRTPDTEY